MSHGIREGDLFAYHHRFFQVTATSERSVVVRPIAWRADGSGARIALRDEFATFYGFDAVRSARGKRCKVLPDGSILLRHAPRMIATPSDGRTEPPWLR